MLSVAFSSTKEIADGNLCTIVLQTISKEQADSAVRLTDVRLYDENSQPLDTSVTDGTISVTAPSAVTRSSGSSAVHCRMTAQRRSLWCCRARA